MVKIPIPSVSTPSTAITIIGIPPTSVPLTKDVMENIIEKEHTTLKKLNGNFPNHRYEHMHREV